MHDATPTMEETRITSSTGGQKGVKDDRYDLIDARFWQELALVCGHGCKKYDDDNWRRGYPWKYTIRAIQSHINAILRGELNDVGDGGSGLHHAAHAAWHCMALFVFSTDPKYAEFDTRLGPIEDVKQPERPEGFEEGPAEGFLYMGDDHVIDSGWRPA